MSQITQRFARVASQRTFITRPPHGSCPISTTRRLPKTSNAKLQNRKLIIAAGGTCVAAGGLLVGIRGWDLPAEDPRDVRALASVPFGKLVSGWIAFAFCAWPTWVDISEPLYNTVSKIPIVSSVADSFVMKTFFAQFLGGETTQECIPRIKSLREAHAGTLLGYNIEAELDGSSKDPELIAAQTRHVLESIDAQGKLAKQMAQDLAAGHDNRFWVRLKATGLLPHPIALQHGSDSILASRSRQGLDKDVAYPGLPHDGDWEAALTGECVTESDRQQLLGLRATVETICNKARENNVRVVLDAEQSWYQPVIDSLTDELLQKYNSRDGPPTLIASFQAYLRRYPQLLDQQIARAEEKGYTLLFKQVRGAYMVAEGKRWEESGRGCPGPVWCSKSETDASYSYGIEKAMSTISSQISTMGSPMMGAVFATHNSISTDLALQPLEKHGLARRIDGSDKLLVSQVAAQAIAFGQLYGMKDDLTNKIMQSTVVEGGLPLVVKSMSYGELEESLPFLARRAIENKTVLEGNLGTAFALGILNGGENSNASHILVRRVIVITATETSQARLHDELSKHETRVDILPAADNARAVEQADVIILAVKPAKRESVFTAPGLRDALRGKLILSIMAGVTTQEIHRLALGDRPKSEDTASLQAVRAMPNMAAQIAQAVTLYSANMETLTAQNQEVTAWVFNRVGTSQAIDEAHFDISAVLVGCAGSLLLLAIDGLLDAAVAEGLRRSDATHMAVNSAIGMLKLVPAGNHPSVLREKIASPGGCLIRALLELERLGVRSAYTSAILLAAERSRAVSKK